MSMSISNRRRWRGVLAGASLTLLLATTNCQVEIGGQTLPSPYYMYDDVQYFPAGPEFKLPREAAALHEQAADQALLDAGR